jgi:hypothetical protein
VRPRRAVTAVALLALAAFYLAAINPDLYQWGDNAHYVIVAKALATGRGLHDIHTPGSPPFAFPIPLFPAALAPIVAVSDYDLIPLKRFVALTGVLAAYAAYALFRTLVDRPQAALLAALTAVSPQVVSFSHQVMTEVPYIALSLAALLWTGRYAAAATSRNRAGAVATLVLAVALLTRSLGVALLLAAGAYLVLEGAGGWALRARKVLLVMGTSAVAWALANAPVLGNVQYVREFREGNAGAPEGQLGVVARLSARVTANLRDYAVAVPETVLYSAYEWESRTVDVVILALLAAGFLHAVVRRRTPAEYYVAFYAAVLLLYEPSNSGNLRRYLVPLVPLALYYFARGLEAVAAAALRTARRPAHGDAAWLRAATLAPLAVVGAANLADSVQASVLRAEPEMFDYARYTDADGYRRMGEWVRAHTDPRGVVAASNSYIFHFWSRRQTVWLPTPADDGAGLAEAARGDRLAYVALDSVTIAQRGALSRALARDTASFALVYDAGWNRVYQVRPAAPPTP